MLTPLPEYLRRETAWCCSPRKADRECRPGANVISIRKTVLSKKARAFCEGTLKFDNYSKRTSFFAETGIRIFIILATGANVINNRKTVFPYKS